MAEKKIYINLLAVLSAFAVVCLHSNGCFWQFSTRHYWLYANIVESFFYFAVPIFFMISGTTLLDYTERYSTTIFLKKRFVKTFIPFVLWSVVAIYSKIYIAKINLRNTLSI